MFHKTADVTKSHPVRSYLMFNTVKSRCHCGWGLITRLNSELKNWQIDVNWNLESICLSIHLSIHPAIHLYILSLFKKKNGPGLSHQSKFVVKKCFSLNFRLLSHFTFFFFFMTKIQEDPAKFGLVPKTGTAEVSHRTHSWNLSEKSAADLLDEIASPKENVLYSPSNFLNLSTDCHSAVYLKAEGYQTVSAQ